MPDLPPGPRAPAVVQTLYWVRRPIPFMEECARRYGDCFTLRFLFPGAPGARQAIVFFSDPQAVKEVFTGDESDLLAGKANAPVLLPLLGPNSLLVLDGARHMRERRLMMPPFHGERMQAYGTVMREIADRAIDAWPLDRAFPIHPHMQGITLDVILRTVFGLDEGPRMGRLRALLTRMLSFNGNPLRFLLMPFELGGLTPWGRLVRATRAVDEVLYDEIRRRRTAGPDGRQDILSMLVAARDEDGQPMTDEALRDEMLTLLLAGHETTATSLCWVFHRVLRRPDVLDRLRAELAEVVGAGPLEPEHLPRLEYLSATINETLRLNPIIPIVARSLNRPLRIGGRELPAGTIVAPCIYLTHRRADTWPDPERFDPDRFVGERASPYAFFPFGGGVRRCLGMAFALYEMRIVLAEVLSRTTLAAAPGYDVRVVRRGITFAPSGGMPVVVAARAA